MIIDLDTMSISAFTEKSLSSNLADQDSGNMQDVTKRHWHLQKWMGQMMRSNCLHTL
jgi:hypothetical protein